MQVGATYVEREGQTLPRHNGSAPWVQQHEVDSFLLHTLCSFGVWSLRSVRLRQDLVPHSSPGSAGVNITLHTQANKIVSARISDLCSSDKNLTCSSQRSPSEFVCQVCSVLLRSIAHCLFSEPSTTPRAQR